MGLSSSTFFGTCIYAPSLEKELLSKLKDSLSSIILLKYFDMTLEYFSFSSTEERIQISAPLWVVFDQRGSYIPSINTIL